MQDITGRKIALSTRCLSSLNQSRSSVRSETYATSQSQRIAASICFNLMQGQPKEVHTLMMKQVIYYIMTVNGRGVA